MNLSAKKISSHNNFISSWSGGKDSCLALYYAVKTGSTPKYLLNMITDSPLAAIKKEFVSKQADSIKIPIIIKNTTWKNYEKDYIDLLKTIVGLTEVDSCVFGDIDTEAHKKWNEDVCSLASLQSLVPLWHQTRRNLMLDFIALGFKPKNGS